MRKRNAIGAGGVAMPWPPREKEDEMGLFGSSKPYKLNEFMSPDGIELLKTSLEAYKKIRSAPNGNAADAAKAGKALKHLDGGALTKDDADFIISQFTVMSIAILASANDLGEEQAQIMAAGYAAQAKALSDQKQKLGL